VDEPAGDVGALAEAAPAAVAGRAVAAVGPDGGDGSSAAPPGVEPTDVLPPAGSDGPATGGTPPAEGPALVDATVIAGPVAAAVTVAPEGDSTVAVGDLEFEVTT
jgi:hypothetical protein